MALSHGTRPVSITTPVGDQLVFLRMIATEELGRLFKFEIDLISEELSINFDDILGQGMTVELETIAGSRYFHGLVSDFRQLQPFEKHVCYRAVLRPWFWFLTRTADCRIFQNMTVPDIIKQIFRDSGFTDFQDNLSGSYREWVYCVQYRESDFNFVSRLMEQEGIYYYFQHEDGKHTLVLSDGPNSHDTLPSGYDTIPYHPPAEQSRREEEHIYDFSLKRQVQTGEYTHTDYDFERPSTDLITRRTDPSGHSIADFEVYDYPGEYVQTSDGQTYSQVRLEENYFGREHILGTGDARGISTGGSFTLENYHRDDQNREYLVAAATYTIISEDWQPIREASMRRTRKQDEQIKPPPLYRCRFMAIPGQQQFRSQSSTPKPLIRGPQTATVVGPSGEEIYTDKYGRVKVQFHWDREGQRDENSSCWIRVSHGWAGKEWGAIYTPRIGQEVIVEFLEGDPDQPIITGRVYNAQQMPPYKLPDNATMSTNKSHSSKEATGFNEIRFEDEKDNEQFWVHAQKDMDIRVLNDRRETIMNDRHLVVENDKFEHVKNDRHEVVDANHYEKVAGDVHLKIEGKQVIGIDSTLHLKVSDDVAEKFEANNSRVVTEDLYIKADNIVIEADTNITINVGDSYIAIDSDGITIGTSGTIEMVADQDITAEASSNIELTASSELTAEGTMGVTISSDMSCSVDGGLEAEVTGTTTTINGDASTDIDGGMITLN